MENEFAISAKDLGALAMPNFCPRCFWLKVHTRGGLPFGKFPGIFSTIDVHTKNCVHDFFNTMKQPPKWLRTLGDAAGYIEPPSHRVFQYFMEPYNVLLRGSPDAVLRFADGKLCIVDYKTAWPLGVDDPLYPIYRIQLNVYAFLACMTNLGDVSKIALAYTTPEAKYTDLPAHGDVRDDGFVLRFVASTCEIDLDFPSLGPLIKRAREIYDLVLPPSGFPACRDCKQLETVIALLNKGGWHQI
jgi:hypothetical protein